MNEIPLSIFIALGLILFALLFLIFRTEHPINLICGILSIMIGFFLSKTSINETLVMTFGGITSGDAIVTGNTVIQNSAMYWIFLFITIIAVGLTIKMIINELEYQLKPVMEEVL